MFYESPCSLPILLSASNYLTHGDKGHLCIVTTCQCGNRLNFAKTINRIRYKSLHFRWRQAKKLRNLCFRRTDDQSQHECQAGEIGQAANRTRLKQLVLIFLSARVRQYSNRLSDENVSSLTVSECWDGGFKCSQIELLHRARECVFDELAIYY